MILQQLHVAVAGFDKPTLLSERMNQPDSTIAGHRVSIGDFILDTSRQHHGLLVVRDGVPVALPDSALTFGDSFLSNFQASLTNFCVPLFGTLSLHSKSFSESRVDTIQYAVFKGVFESFSFTKRKSSLVLELEVPVAAPVAGDSGSWSDSATIRIPGLRVDG
jgi:hypothetical protein